MRWGAATHDLLRLRAGDLAAAPDAVVYPRGTEEVLAVLALASERAIAVIPYGGGTARRRCQRARGAFKAAITLDLSAMDRLIEVDQVAGTATLEAGICGPALEKALQAKGFTLGHYPQSFEFSTLGGWIVIRGIGQSANRYGRAEDWLVGVKLATPRGLLTGRFSRLLRAFKDFVLGSEGFSGSSPKRRAHSRPACGQLLSRLSVPRFRKRHGGSPRRPEGRNRDGDAAPVGRGRDALRRAFRRLGKPRPSPGGLPIFACEVHGFDDKACVLIAGFEGDRRGAPRRNNSAPSRASSAPCRWAAVRATPWRRSSGRRGRSTPKLICRQMTELIQKQPLAEIDYISIADAETLDELDMVKPPALVSLAVKIGKTRLIDNVVMLKYNY